MKKLKINKNEKEIEVTLIRKNVKNINLRVKDSGEITVTANNKVDEEYIIDFLKRKMDWILKHIDEFEERKKLKVKKEKLLKDNNIIYLGNIYKIKGVKSNKEYVKLGKDEIYVFLKDKDNLHKINLALNRWYKDKINEIFLKVYRETFKKFKRYNIKHVEIKSRKMKRRWGSCNPNDRIITLNSELITRNIECIEFVMAHELAHLVHANHSKDFYEVLEDVMPDWKSRKEALGSI